MAHLDEFGAEPAREVRAPAPHDDVGLDVVECPCGASLPMPASETIAVDSGRFAPDGLRALDSDVRVRGWTCDRSGCNRVIVETLELAKHHGHDEELLDGWYPVSIALDGNDESALVFTPKDHVDELLDRDGGRRP